MRNSIYRSVRGACRGRRGFNLIEVAVATALVGIGVAALMTAVGATTRTNNAGRQLTEAVFLAQEIREWTLKLPFSDPDPADADNPPGPDGRSPQTFVDDLDDLLSVTYSPPRDGQGSAITDMTGWSQQISLTWRHPSHLTASITPGTSDMIYVDLVISYQGREVLSTGWLVARRQEE